MRIAIIGSGISGLVCAWRLSRQYAVTLYEMNHYFGGHTHTHAVKQDGQDYAVDSGFIVHNQNNYPHFTALLDTLGVPSQATTMSFSVHKEASALEYNATSFDTLFCQRRNFFSPRFIGMVRDLLRFYREAPALLTEPSPGPTLGEYLKRERYSDAFRDDHLIPMASALWSSPASCILAFPAQYMVRFMANHQMLQTKNRPPWRVVQGGSRRYIDAMRATWRVRERLSTPVHAVRRELDRVFVTTQEGSETYDQVIFACHSDQALKLLVDPTPAERSILGAIHYQKNQAVLHTDVGLLPKNTKAWAAWNAYVPASPSAPCSVSYCMNLLQGLRSRLPFIVTLNRSEAIKPEHILAQMHYEHPVYTLASVAARSRRHEISGHRRSWYAGAYWGWGFHEDGVVSALDVVNAIELQSRQALRATL